MRHTSLRGIECLLKLEDLKKKDSISNNERRYNSKTKNEIVQYYNII